MKNILRIALMQLLPGSTPEETMEISRAACETAKDAGADIALFPEMWSCGYHIPQDPRPLALSADSGFVRFFGELAGFLHMAIGIPFLESWEPMPRNTLALFDRHGEKVLTYAKVHTCDFGDECQLTPGEDFYVTELDTACGPVQVGAMICYDREFPESARILMLKGAELVLTPNACPMEINRLSQLRGRAFENMMAIATCNYPAGKADCNGHSTVFDGVAYHPDWPVSRDTCILDAGEEIGVHIAELDLAMLRQYRREEVHGNAYRHPQKYGILTKTEIRPPFVRDDYRG